MSDEMKRICPELREQLAARVPIIYLLTSEEERGVKAVEQSLNDFQVSTHKWTHVSGLDGTGQRKNPDEILAFIREQAMAMPEKLQIFTLIWMHEFLKNTKIKRLLGELQRDLPATATSIVLLSPVLALPGEFMTQGNLPVIRLPLPDRDDMRSVLGEVYGSTTNASCDPEEELVDAMLGMTEIQAKAAVRRSIATRGGNVRTDKVIQCKADAIQSSGILELVNSEVSMDDVGGYDQLVEWLFKRRRAFTAEAQEYGLPYPKGVLLLGFPGCGKSLMAKAVAASWKLPLMRLDVGRVFGSLVGQSEEQMRAALDQADAAAPAILWIDEIEKALAGSGTGDSGVTDRVKGTLLTWMQERKSSVFVIATANDITRMPPEMLRKGRWDEIFFVAFPDEGEREKIFNIHINKKGRNPDNYQMDELIKLTEGFSGAEIEQSIVEALYEGFDANREMETDDIIRSIRSTTPLSKTMKEMIDAVGAWAASRCRFASARAEQEAHQLKKTVSKVLDISGTPEGVLVDKMAKDSGGGLN